MNKSQKQQIILWSLALIVIFAVATIFGWKVFYGYVIHQANNLSAFSTASLYLFAFGAGLISNFGLCSLAVLPAYLSFYLGLDDHNGQHSPLKRSLKLGFVASLGVFAFFLFLGILFAAAGTSLAVYSNQLKIVVAVIIFLAGASMIKGGCFKNIVSHASTGTSRSVHLFAFGVIYGAGGLACFLPIFLPLILFPFLGGAFVTSVISFLVFSLGQAFFLTTATILVGKGKHTFLKSMAGKSELIKKIAGWILILTSVILIMISVVVGM